MAKAKSLIIVESPSKAKTINKYLGKKYKVMASVGHVKDLPKARLGIDLEHDFKPEYTVIKGKKEVLTEIKKAATEADQIFLAPDPDREGEAIAWHIAEELKAKLKSKDGRVYRVLFNEITERAIKAAMEHPGKIDLKKVNAQQARRVLDRIVGYMISPLLWEKVRRGLSAGRVQSVAVRLICEREAEVLAFVPEEYWSLSARLRGKNPPPFVAKLHQRGGQKVQIVNEAAAQELVSLFQGETFVVSAVDKKERRQRPTAPFTTSKMQQDAARKLRFTPKKTMMLAQQLYEGVELGEEGPVGLITYMRTDSTRVAPEAQTEAKETIRERFGQDYLPETPNLYKSKKGAQEAHEAIRPTSVQRIPDQIKRFLTRDQYNLYKLIWDRFMASQMAPAILDVTRVDITAGECLLRATGSTVRFPGFTVIYTEGKDEAVAGEKQKKAPGTAAEAEEEDLEEEAGVLPSLSVGERLTLEELLPKQHFTQPPPRYNEALLIRDLEEKGIGRPSTYAAIISTIQDRKYVEKREGRFFPTDLGSVVNELLVQHFPDVLNVEFTARMENELDGIEEGDKEWVQTVRDFYQPFDKRLAKAQVEMRNVKREEIPTEVPCEKCGRHMVIKWGRYGRFLACSGYPECKSTKEFVETDGEIRPVEPEAVTNEFCEKCGKPMIVKTGRFGRFLACSGYPDCKTTRPLQTGVACPQEGCAGFLVEKRSKRGKVFYACSKYPACTFALWDRPVPKACPQCSAPFLVEKRSKGGGAHLVCRADDCGYKEEKEEN